MDEKQKAYQDQVEAQLHVWAARIAELKAKAENSEAKARVRYHEEIEDLQNRENEVRAKLAKLRNAGSDAWESLKEGIEHAIHDLRGA